MKKPFAAKHRLVGLAAVLATPVAMAHPEVTPLSGAGIRAAHELAHLLAAAPLILLAGLALIALVIRTRRRVGR